MNIKRRYIRTIPEKYSHDDVYALALHVIEDNRKLDRRELFRKLPYIGYLRIPCTSEYSEWWTDSNDDYVNAKVLKVNDSTVVICHFDSHHYDITVRQPKFEGFVVEGNLLKKMK